MNAWAVTAITIGLIALSAFFVVIELALIGARRHRLEQEAGEKRSARAALRGMNELTIMLAGAQLGITACTFALGAVTKPAVDGWLGPVFASWGLPEWLAGGAAFALSFVSAPFLLRGVGVPGIFALTAALALAAMAVVQWIVPDAPREERGPPVPLATVLGERELLRLNAGIFALHAVLMALFVVVPLALVRAGLPAGEHWYVYLGTLLAGVALMLPAVDAGGPAAVALRPAEPLGSGGAIG